ncbi:MAG TPA: FAD-dependent oxidoreductase [Vicinamibacterales bacterium]|jgi:glycine/D-amino acid oxidase-like deaminating enzyme|nr:FAD-dependent oxidoreductase [Vicinamibacterales bacterium]
MRIVVVGAGCFGSWSAVHLARAGHDVTLVDAYGPGHSRSSSGGETRVIRMGYGDKTIYTQWSRRSLDLWKSLFDRAGAPLFLETGVLWMARDDEALATKTLATLGDLGIPHERLSRADLETRWPQIDFGSIAFGILEPESGVLLARRAVALVAGAAMRAGARYVAAAVKPPRGHARLESVATESGDALPAAAFVFACGPWLPTLFPDLLGDRLFITKQEVVYLGPPAGDVRFAPPRMPAWIDFGREMYGIPDIDGRGFKIALDRHGPPFDADAGTRVAGDTFDDVRAYVARRFPALGRAPIVGAEVCQYENTSNGDFLIDRHPSLENVWIAGGGSGHGFKHGPAVGEYVARLIAGDAAPEPRFLLAAKDRIQRRSVY